VRTELVSIATDTTPLDGAYYTPEDAPPRAGVLLMHGNTMNFYVGPPRFLPPYLTELGCACLAFNRRGHDVLSIRGSKQLDQAEGAAFQTAAEGMADNDLAAAFLAERGLAEPIVIGHSNGGMLAAQFAAAHPETRGLVLLSAHAGGLGTLMRGGWADLSRLTAEAERLVAAGQGRQLLLVSAWWWVLSAESFLDRLRHTPDTLEAAPRITCPVLFIRGEDEPEATYPAYGFQQRAGGPCEVAILPDCDHFYTGQEDRVARTIVSWLGRRLSGAV
jgi:pimeloyl-ACP methyl ester carboxylesterase